MALLAIASPSAMADGNPYSAPARDQLSTPVVIGLSATAATTVGALMTRQSGIEIKSHPTHQSIFSVDTPRDPTPEEIRKMSGQVAKRDVVEIMYSHPNETRAHWLNYWSTEVRKAEKEVGKIGFKGDDLVFNPGMYQVLPDGTRVPIANWVEQPDMTALALNELNASTEKLAETRRQLHNAHHNGKLSPIIDNHRVDLQPGKKSGPDRFMDKLKELKKDGKKLVRVTIKPEGGVRLAETYDRVSKGLAYIALTVAAASGIEYFYQPIEEYLGLDNARASNRNERGLAAEPSGKPQEQAAATPKAAGAR